MKWNEEKKCYRLVHPETKDFIGEFYPDTMELIVTKHKKTCVIDLWELIELWRQNNL